MTAPAPSYPAATPVTASLREVREGLVAPREQIESTFLAVGAGLAEGAAILNLVARTFEALPAKLQSPDLLEAAARLANVGEQARAISATFATEQADLARLVTVVAAAKHPIGELSRAVKMMGIVAINARVVAAGVAANGEDFDVFTTDIARLSEGATATIQAFTLAYQRLSAEVGHAAYQRGQSENAQADTLHELALGMDKGLADLASQRAVSIASAAQTGQITRQIVGGIGNAVMALQVGDATRQRIEHVESGLDDLHGLMDDPALPPDEATIAQASLGGLLTAQLAAAADAFEGDVAQAGQALRALAEDASAIMEQSRAIYGQGNAGDSSLVALSQAVRHAGQVLRDCEAERGKLETVAQAVLGTVGELLSHVTAVQEIEANMRLVSINAAIRCAQLGPRGAALNVIATQLRALTGETVIAADTAMDRLREATDLARSFGAAANGDTASQVGQLEQEASESLILLEGVDSALTAALGALHRDGPVVRDLLGKAVAAFDRHAAILECMRDLQLTLVSARPPMAPGAPTGAIADALATHRQRYTMDDERRIHAEMFGAETSSEPSAATEPDSDDIFF